jgi:Holliday junction resolvase RusA-like endonuclease
MTMGRKAILRKHPDLDFFIGQLGGPEIPTKQDKFKPLEDYEIVIEENGERKVITDHKLYMKKDGKDSLKEFSEHFRETLKGSLTEEHPYKREVPLELVISVSMNERRAREVDIDNLVKAVVDCMKGIVFEDDTQIVKILASKDVNSFGPLNGLLVGLRKLDKRQSWFENVRLAYFEYEEESK